MEYMSAMEASQKWGVSLRQVQRLLAQGRVDRAQKYGRAWMIPRDAKKPIDPRRERKLPGRPGSSEFSKIIMATSIPMPPHHPDGILQIVKEEKHRMQYEAELAYLRGDFARVMQCYHKTEGDDAARLRASLVAVAAVISLGDYPAYQRMAAYLNSLVEADRNSEYAAAAELALASVAVNVTAPNMAPAWLIEGDFSALPQETQPPHLLYLRAKYFICIDQYETALAVAQTALAFRSPEGGITFPEIYLRVVCALACHHLGHEEEGERWLLQAMQIALPHGFLTPFAESVSAFGGLIEQCLEQAFPDWVSAVIEQWKRTVKNWITFHNHFTRDHITLILSLREYHLATLVARRVPYEKIARQFNISVGRLKNIMQEIYEKLFISSRDELAEYVLLQKTRPIKGKTHRRKT